MGHQRAFLWILVTKVKVSDAYFSGNVEKLRLIKFQNWSPMNLAYMQSKSSLGSFGESDYEEESGDVLLLNGI